MDYPHNGPVMRSFDAWIFCNLLVTGGFTSQRPSKAELSCSPFCNHLQDTEQGSSYRLFETTWCLRGVGRFIRWNIAVFSVIFSTKRMHRLLITFRLTGIQSFIFCSLWYRQNIIISATQIHEYILCVKVYLLQWYMPPFRIKRPTSACPIYLCRHQ